MTKTVIILTAVALIANGCRQTPKEQTDKEPYQKEMHEASESEISEIVLENGYNTSEQKYLIKEGGVDIFLVGQNIPTQTDRYVITKSIETRADEGEYFEMLVYTVLEDEQELLNLEPNYYDAEGNNDTIDNIYILSDKFKTAENIGLDSTIEEFITAYPDFLIWFSYISGIYVIETTKLKGVQFFLDGNDFKDGAGPAFDSDMTILKPSDFKKSSKIKKIRIWD